MKPMRNMFCASALAVAVAAALPGAALAGGDDLREEVEALKRELAELRALLNERTEQAASRQEVGDLKKQVTEVGKAHSEWKEASSVVHLAGYGSVGYTDNDPEDGRFNQVQFSPIFHYQYKDLMMLEAELEFVANAAGGTDVAMEYAALDLFLNDYVTLVAGKFISPLGQFRQNIHPSWINRLPSAPPGFGHGGAAPSADVGLQLRGGFPLGGMRANYAAYVANGPELEAGGEAGETDAEIHEVATEGVTGDQDKEKVVGGRFGLLPMPGLEIGLSLASGKVMVTALDAEAGFLGALGAGEPDRDYDVRGMDFAWKPLKGLGLRGEYIEQEVGAAAASVAPEAHKWETWYAQAAYKFLPTKWEGVLRYSDFDSPHASEDQKQWAFGVNYLFASNVIAKLAWEANDGQNGAAADQDRFLIQMAYGF